MRTNCDTWVSDPKVGASSQCGKPAVILILTETEQEECQGPFTGDHYDSVVTATLTASGYCEQHAPEEVHEVKSSMSEDEYLVVNLPPQGVNQHTAPVGTLALLGHPSNNTRIVNTAFGWYTVDALRRVKDEDFRAGWVVLS